MQGLNLSHEALQHVYGKLNLSAHINFGLEQARGVKMRDEFIKAVGNFYEL